MSGWQRNCVRYVFSGSTTGNLRILIFSSKQKMGRLSDIEGLRAYLAFWVVIGHCLQLSGYSGQEWSGLLKLIRSANYAVDIFMLVSGFVIFYLLDHKKESYLGFITRRFFRLWPLFILMFIISIPISLVARANFTILGDLYPYAEMHSLLGLYKGGWEAPIAHIAAHLTMLHGVIPEQVLSGSPTAFLPPGWSISLEWQFYLVAPLCFAAFRSSNMKRALFFLMIVAGYSVSNKFLYVQLNAFLPMYPEYFLVGGVSYFVYQNLIRSGLKIRLLPIGVGISLLLLFMLQTLDIVPLCFWLPFCCHLVDRHNHKSQGFTSRLFNNRMAQYFGRISYSVYLSHIIIITLLQYVIVNFMGDMSQLMHLGILTLCTLVLTALFSGFLYYTVEVNGMALGGRLAEKFAQKDVQRYQPGRSQTKLEG